MKKTSASTMLLLACLAGCGTTPEVAAVTGFPPPAADAVTTQAEPPGRLDAAARASAQAGPPARSEAAVRAPASPAVGPESLRHIFNDLDRNRDGRLSADEYVARKWPDNPYPRGTFRFADLDQDGALQRDEFEREIATREATAKSIFELHDTNRDGFLPPWELMKAPLWRPPPGGWKSQRDKEDFVKLFIADIGGNAGAFSLIHLRIALMRGIPQPVVALTGP